jgi:uncharacterized protein DUF4166/saccharopine dehydrogenase-like protein
VTRALKILIVGGYGTFGGRLIELLEHEPRLTLIVAGRSLEKARAFCAGREKMKAALTPMAFDRDGDVSSQLAMLAPEIVIDTSGPFQAYGAQPYRLIEACIAARIHYLDLADGSDFVAGVSAFDETAQMAGVFVLSGVSSYPVLTAAAARVLSHGMHRVETIRAGIAPSPYAGVGKNVIRAIASYSGKRVNLMRNGAMTQAHAITDHTRFTVAPPGVVPLRPRLFSLVDAPDLRLLPQVWPGLKEVWAGAGTEPAISHRVLIGFAWLVRLGLLPSLSFLASAMHVLSSQVRWGEHRGGMFVEVTGLDASDSATRSWHLLAEGDAGPFIPSMGIAAIIRKMLAGVAPQPGSRAALHDLGLDDYALLFAERGIVTGIRDTVPHTAPLYERVMNTAWTRLPAPIRDMHDVTNELTAEGRSDIDRGTGPLARLVAAIFGFPKPGHDVPVRVNFRVVGRTEIWTRTFAGKSFSSRQYEGTGRWSGVLCERFGPFVFAMALPVDGDRMNLVLRGWSAFGIPMPMLLCPRSQSYEVAEDGRFRFHVEIKLPLIGLIVRYRGWLEPLSGPKTSS